MRTQGFAKLQDIGSNASSSNSKTLAELRIRKVQCTESALLAYDAAGRRLCLRSDVSLQSMILIEIQDTMAQPPSEEKSMKKATHTGIAITVSLLSI